jgi:hypothetical protein
MFKRGDKVKFIEEGEYDSTPNRSRSTFTKIPIGTIAYVLSVGSDGWPEVDLGSSFKEGIVYIESDILVKLDD